MKKSVLLLYTTLSVLFVLSSCSVHKRVYRDGYHVEWNHKKNEVKQDLSSPDISESVAEAGDIAEPVEDPVNGIAAEEENPVTASAEEKPVIEKKKSFISRIIKDDTPEEEALIISGSKSAAFKSGFKKGLMLMLPVQDGDMSRMAVASFILGILSLFAYYGAFVLGVLAIIFGAIAIKRIRNSGGSLRGNTLAWIGLICGIISIALAFIIIRIY
jgi:hypothetical protein